MTHPGNLELRLATPADAATLAAIYAPYVEHTAITAELQAPSADEFRTRIATTLERYPYLVAQRDGVVLGYSYAGRVRTREAYAHSVEMTVYVRQDAQAQGVGRLLYGTIERILARQGVTNLYALIFSSSSAHDPFLTGRSQGFHLHMGYTQVGLFRKCGYKLGRWYDALWMEKIIAAHHDEPAAFVPFPELDVCVTRKILEQAMRGETAEQREHTDSAGALVFRRAAACPEGAEADASAYEVLMISMRNGNYSFPKGHLLPDESLEECAKREVFEETGVRIAVIPGFCREVDSARVGDRRSVFFLLATCEPGQGDELIPQLSEVQSAFWEPVSSAVDLASFPADRKTLVSAFKAFCLLSQEQ